MCRGIVGTLVQVGQGKIAAGEINKILHGKDRRLAGMTAPAHGLVLWKVFYEKTAETRRGGGKRLIHFASFALLRFSAANHEHCFS